MIYLDNNATTALHPRVKDRIIEFLDHYGNPSSAHSLGREVKEEVDQSRREIAGFLNCHPDELIYTASGSEANNTILKSAASACCNNNCSVKTHIISSQIEHPSVLNTLKFLQGQGVDVTFLPVDQYGMVNPEDVKKAIRPETSLVSIMFANNEIGTIQPIKEITEIAHAHNILMHTDAVQAVGRVPIDLEDIPVDYLTLSGHKIYAPKGIGVLYRRSGAKGLCPLICGGHQEQNLRAGTENTIGIIAIGEAFKQLKNEMDECVKRQLTLRNRLEKGLLDSIDNIKINGHPDKRLCTTLNVSFKTIEGESILLRLDLFGIAVSTGSACSSGSLDPSHVITALDVPPEIAHSSVRFSLGRDTTEEDIDKTIEVTGEVVKFLRKISPIK